MTGQESPAGGIEGQLEATLQSIEYLRGLEVGVRTGDTQALRAIERSTEPARDATPQRAAHLETLQDDIARLRFNLDRLLVDPGEVEAIMSMPPSVVRASVWAAPPSRRILDRSAAPRVGADGAVAIPRPRPTAPRWRSPIRSRAPGPSRASTRPPA